LYLQLDRPYPADVAAPIAKRLCTAAFSDAVHNPNRIMRLPGTWNLKDMTYPCYVREVNNFRYTLDTLIAAMDEAGAPPVDDVYPLDDAAAEMAPRDTDALIARLPVPLRYAVETGRAPESWGDMSKLDWAIVLMLVLDGATDVQIRAIYESYPVRAFKAGREGPHYFELTLKKARAEATAQLADRSVDAALLATGVFYERPDGVIVPDMPKLRQQFRDFHGLDRGAPDVLGNEPAN
jgi:hypothetical protein